MSHDTAFEKPVSPGQLKEIMATLMQAIPAELSSEDAQRIIENKKWLIGEVQDLFTLRKLLLAQWVEFYREVLPLHMIDVDFSALKIPKRRRGFDRLIVVAHGLTLKGVITAAQKYFPVDFHEPWKYFYGVEETRGTHDRVPSKPYAVWVRDQADPDTEYTDIPARLLKQRGVQGITLLEHLLFNLKTFTETGTLLDRNATRTYCFGSRDSGGAVPVVFAGDRRAGKSLYVTCRWYLNHGFSVREVIAQFKFN